MRPLPLALILLLGACNTPDPSPAESPKAPRVQFVQMRHPIGPDLTAFLARIEAGYGDRIVVRARSAAEGEALAQGLLRQGLRAQVLVDPAHEVVVARHVVTPPDCPDWTRSGAADFTTQAATNFGCATATNLGLMVADPGDLVRGRAAPAMEAEAATLGVQRYRTGKTPPLPDADTRGGGQQP